MMFTPIRVEEAARELTPLTEEIHFKDLVSRPNFKAGLIAFRPGGTTDPKQVDHLDKDVVCYVIRGKGRLRTDGGIRSLESGMLCHVPAKTPHDFAALDEEMLLLYILIDQPPA